MAHSHAVCYNNSIYCYYNIPTQAPCLKDISGQNVLLMSCPLWLMGNFFFRIRLPSDRLVLWEYIIHINCIHVHSYNVIIVNDSETIQ